MERNGGGTVLERAPVLVVDASVAVKWFVKEPLRERALRVRQDYAERRVGLLAPYLIFYEVGNAIRFHPGSNPEQVAEAIDYLTGMQMEGGELSSELVETASRIAFDEGLAFYDAVYLALAETRRGKLLTDDRKLYEKVKKRRSLLQLLEHY